MRGEAAAVPPSTAKKALVIATEILSPVNGTTVPLRFIIFSWPGAVAVSAGDSAPWSAEPACGLAGLVGIFAEDSVCIFVVPKFILNDLSVCQSSGRFFILSVLLFLLDLNSLFNLSLIVVCSFYALLFAFYLLPAFLPVYVFATGFSAIKALVRPKILTKSKNTYVLKPKIWGFPCPKTQDNGINISMQGKVCG
jgi:hypothetical protein